MEWVGSALPLYNKDTHKIITQLTKDEDNKLAAVHLGKVTMEREYCT
jgi:hypothetical protein